MSNKIQKKLQEFVKECNIIEQTDNIRELIKSIKLTIEYMTKMHALDNIITKGALDVEAPLKLI